MGLGENRGGGMGKIRQKGEENPKLIPSLCEWKIDLSGRGGGGII